MIFNASVRQKYYFLVVWINKVLGKEQLLNDKGKYLFH